MMVVSYGTADGVYDVFLRRLEESCNKSGIKTDFVTIPPTTRESACRYKPFFLSQMLDKHQQPIVWLDADAIVQRPFTLPVNPSWDVGTIPNNRRRHRKQYPVAAFVIAFRPTDASRRFLSLWQQLCQENNFASGADHIRLVAARQMLKGSYSEADLSRSLHHAITRDAGRRKEGVIETDAEWFVRWLWWKARRLTVRNTGNFT